MSTFFSECFEISAKTVHDYGAFDVSLITDLPLFIDPFLLFNSKRAEYRALHDRIIEYLVFLRNKAVAGHVSDPLLRAWYCFPEVDETWLGFTVMGNQGHGLGMDFARALHGSLHDIFSDFGAERITKGSHLEKVCLIKDGVGRDNISDFTTNLIKEFLYDYTEKFAKAHLIENQCRRIAIRSVVFNYDTETWETREFVLPWTGIGHVVLVPKDMLTRDENWINRADMLREFSEIPVAIPDQQLRAQVSNYFERMLSRRTDREPTMKEQAVAAERTIANFPELIDYYIKSKENRGDKARDVSALRIKFSEILFHEQTLKLQGLLKATGAFDRPPATREECLQRLHYLKDVVENKGGHRIFYVDDQPIRREIDLQIMFRLVWHGTPSDVTTEANDGRGPADFKVSRGAHDKTIVEMKLAKNTGLRRNLEYQVEIYQRASDANAGLKAIIFFTPEEQKKVEGILDDLKLRGHEDIVLIDARDDNKPSASKASSH